MVNSSEEPFQLPFLYVNLKLQEAILVRSITSINRRAVT